MPGTLLHQGAIVQCQHGGTATASVAFPRVKVSGQPLVLQTTSYTIAACSFAPPTGNGPCATAQWISAAVRIKANKLPVLLSDSKAACVPTGTGLMITMTQQRVKGQ